jgi:hypothetical protein
MIKAGYTGSRYHYYTYDVEPDRDGKYHVGEGTQWHWEHKGVYKTAKGAKNWAVKKNGGRDDYRE